MSDKEKIKTPNGHKPRPTEEEIKKRLIPIREKHIEKVKEIIKKKTQDTDKDK